MHNTLPDTPGALLGHWPDGRPFYVIAGGDDTDDPPAGDDPQPASQPPASMPDPAPGAQAAGPDPASPPAGQQSVSPGVQEPAADVSQLPPWAQKLLRETRNEAAANRAKARDNETKLAELEARQKDQMDGIAKVLGLKQDDGPPDPDRLLAQLAQEQLAREAEAQRARQLSVELAVYRTAAPQGADGNKLLDSRAFLTSVQDLDPSLADFEDQVKDKIAEAVERYPAYRLNGDSPAPAPAPPAPTIPRSGGDFGSSPPQGPRQWTQEDVDRATPAELSRAIDQGLLANLGVGQPRGRNRR